MTQLLDSSIEKEVSHVVVHNENLDMNSKIDRFNGLVNIDAKTARQLDVGSIRWLATILSVIIVIIVCKQKPEEPKRNNSQENEPQTRCQQHINTKYGPFVLFHKTGSEAMKNLKSKRIEGIASNLITNGRSELPQGFWRQTVGE